MRFVLFMKKTNVILAVCFRRAPGGHMRPQLKKKSRVKPPWATHFRSLRIALVALVGVYREKVRAWEMVFTDVYRKRARTHSVSSSIAT